MQYATEPSLLLRVWGYDGVFCVAVWASLWITCDCFGVFSKCFSFSRSLSRTNHHVLIKITLPPSPKIQSLHTLTHLGKVAFTLTCTVTSIVIPGSKWKAHQSERRQRDTHKEGDIYDSWVFWVSVSCKDYYWLQLHHVGCCWAGGASSAGHLLCFNFTVGMIVHQSAVSAVFFLSLEAFLRKGTIGPVERNIRTTRKIIEHVTDSYHIDCLMEVNLGHWRDNAISNYSRNATSLQQQKVAFFHCSPCSKINEAVVLPQCVQRRKLQVYPPWNRTHTHRAKDHRTQSTVKWVLGMKAN